MTTISREEAIKRAVLVDGWTTPVELDLLYGMARQAESSIVEIGSWQGRSTAALALGSMAGRNQPVFAIDPFLGVPPCDRKTDLKTDPSTVKTGPELLRANLDTVGVNGQVKIIPKASQDALCDVPEDIALLFIDGSHAYEDVARDIRNYLPRVRMGGFVVFHDTDGADPGVMRAIEDYIQVNPRDWRILDRVDSALVVRRVKTERRVVRLMCPGNHFKWGAVCGFVQCTLGAHRVDLDNNGNGFDDFNAMWARALNEFEAGRITHAAMLHADIQPQAGWLDILMDEIEEKQADLISVACAMKDQRGLCNAGLSDEDHWRAFRRFAVSELRRFPPTFDASHTDHPDKILLHNTGCWVADLRRPIFRQTDEAGNLIAWFDFPTRICRDEKNGKWINKRESEDWFFSRQLHLLGARTFITRKVKINHIGDALFSNHGDWGIEECDEAGRHLWEPDLIARGITPPPKPEKGKV